MTEETRRAWDALGRGEGEQGSGLLVRRIAAGTTHDIRIGIDLSDGTRLLAMELSGGDATAVGPLPSARGFVARITHPREGGRLRRTIRLSATHRSYADLFAKLVDDVVERIVATTGAADAVAVLMERLTRWQAFMRSCAADGLSADQQRGLFGELCALRDVLIPALGRGHGIESWTGPRGAPQDFRGAAWAVEVKTVLAPMSTVHITNEAQLDESGLDSLMLLAVQLAESKTSGNSLPDLISVLRAMAADDPIASEALNDRLFLAGYLDDHADRYRTERWRQVAMLFFDVRDNFPRIRKANLPPGVRAVRYQLDLSVCSPHELSVDTALSRLRPNREDHV